MVSLESCQSKLAANPANRKALQEGWVALWPLLFHTHTSIPQVVVFSRLPLIRGVTLHGLLMEKGHTTHCITSGCLMLAFSLVIKNSDTDRHHRCHGDIQTNDLEYDRASFSHLTTSQTIFCS